MQSCSLSRCTKKTLCFFFSSRRRHTRLQGDWSSDVCSSDLRTRAADYQRDVRERLMIGAFVTGVQYVRGQQARQLLRQEVDAVLERRDVLLAPATPIPAPLLGEKETTLGDGTSDVRSALIRFTRPFNLSGHPVCSVACGFTTSGLPIGMQIVGRPFDEATVLRAADAYQRSTDWHTRHPVLA